MDGTVLVWLPLLRIVMFWGVEVAYVCHMCSVVPAGR